MVPLDPRGWPLTLKVPLLVVALMLGVSLLVSQQVLGRLAEIQRAQLAALAGAYLDGLSTVLLPLVRHDDVWEVYDNLDRAQGLYAGLDLRHTLVARPNGLVLAASDPRAFPAETPVPERFTLGSGELAISEPDGTALAARPLLYQGREVGSIYAEIDLAALLAERRRVLWALFVSNALLTLALALIGYLAVRRMLRPLGRLTAQIERLRAGDFQRLPESELGDPRSELGRLNRRLDALSQALAERAVLARRLAEEERIASLGRLTSGMAHEINNPLGGLLNAVDTLKSHGGDAGVRTTALVLLERGLLGIRDVVRAALVTYKGGADPQRLRRQDIDDLQHLVKHEVTRRRLRLDWRNELPEELPLPGGAVRQMLLNLLLNACAASPVGGCVTLEARSEAGGVSLQVMDQGPGLPEPARRCLAETAAAAPPTGTPGLGLWIVRRLLDEMDGRITVEEEGRGGTRILLLLPWSERERLDHVA